jgi:hypothetical protein
VVDDGGTLARSPGALGRADVRRHLLDTVTDVRRAAACHRPQREQWTARCSCPMKASVPIAKPVATPASVRQREPLSVPLEVLGFTR